jgi:hypothetical protein
VGVTATYCIDYHVVSFEPSTVVGALAHRAVPTMTGYHVTIPWTEPRYSQRLLALAIPVLAPKKISRKFGCVVFILGSTDI